MGGKRDLRRSFLWARVLAWKRGPVWVYPFEGRVLESRL